MEIFVSTGFAPVDGWRARPSPPEVALALGNDKRAGATATGTKAIEPGAVEEVPVYMGCLVASI